MRDCAKETENERDHIVLPKGPGDNALPARRQSYSDGRGRAGLTNGKLFDKHIDNQGTVYEARFCQYFLLGNVCVYFIWEGYSENRMKISIELSKR